MRVPGNGTKGEDEAGGGDAVGRSFASPTGLFAIRGGGGPSGCAVPQLSIQWMGEVSAPAAVLPTGADNANKTIANRCRRHFSLPPGRLARSAILAGAIGIMLGHLGTDGTVWTSVSG